MSDEEYRLINFSLDNIVGTLKTAPLTDAQREALARKFAEAASFAGGHDGRQG